MPGRKPTVSDVEILREFMLAGQPVLTTSDLSDPLGMTRQGVHARLQKLEGRGLVRSKEVGSKARVWWITDDGEMYVAENR